MGARFVLSGIESNFTQHVGLVKQDRLETACCYARYRHPDSPAMLAGRQPGTAQMSHIALAFPDGAPHVLQPHRVAYMVSFSDFKFDFPVPDRNDGHALPAV